MSNLPPAWAERAREIKDLGCKRCRGPVPQFDFGRGYYYITLTNAERGPYCSERCMDEARAAELEEKARAQRQARRP